jgi:hypothetical protein
MFFTPNCRKFHPVETEIAKTIWIIEALIFHLGLSLACEFVRPGALFDFVFRFLFYLDFWVLVRDRRPQEIIAGHGDIFSARENEKHACGLPSNVVHREYAYGRVRADVLPHGFKNSHGFKNQYYHMDSRTHVIWNQLRNGFKHMEDCSFNLI